MGPGDYNDLFEPSAQHENIVSSGAGLAKHPILGISAFVGASIMEHQMLNPMKMRGALGSAPYRGLGTIPTGSFDMLGLGAETSYVGEAAAARARYAGRMAMGDLHQMIRQKGWKGLRGFAQNVSLRDLDPALSSKGLRGYKHSQALYGAVEERFGKRFAGRVMVGRALAGVSSAMNLFFLAELGGMAGNFVGSMIESWRPNPAKPENRRTIETGGNFVDTRIAWTQRQRAIQAIHNSMLTTRAAMGNEASFIHGY